MKIIKSILTTDNIPPVFKSRTMHSQFIGIFLGTVMFAIPELEQYRELLILVFTAFTLAAMKRFTDSNTDQLSHQEVQDAIREGTEFVDDREQPYDSTDYTEESQSARGKVYENDPSKK